MSISPALLATQPHDVARKAEAEPHHSNHSEPAILSAQCGYDLWAQSYDREPNPLLALEERLLTPMLPNLQGRTVLDLACGTGRWLGTLLRLGAASGIGVDCSASMLAAAAGKPSLQGRLVRADGLALPLPGATVDVMVCSFAIRHFREPHMLATEIRRVASPGAAIYISDVHPAAYQRGFLRTRFRSNGTTVEIATFSRPLEQLFATFTAQGFDLTESVEGHLGDAERPVFARAGRMERFHELRGVPAIFIARFRPTGP